MIIERTSYFPCSAERCFAEVKKTRLMLHIAKPILYFSPIQPKFLPKEWEELEYNVGLKLFGFLPIGQQIVRISGRDNSTHLGYFSVELRDNGYGTFMSKWDHKIIIESNNDGCIYTDKVEVRAGVFTPFIWLFAWMFYGHRQRRWLKLIEKDFNYE